MSDFLSALPARQLHARPPSVRSNTIWVLIGLAMFSGFLLYLGGWVAPVLLTDWQIRDHAVRVRGGGISDGECTSKLFIQTCDVTLSAPVGTGQVERRVHYFFGSTQLGDFQAVVVADPAHPEWLSTDLGLDYFWDRAVSLGAAGLLLCFVVGFGAVAMVRNRNQRRAWREAAAVPVPLNLTAIQRSRNGTVWTVQSETGQVARWTVPRKATPFVLGPASRILGLATRGGASVMPLDSQLTWVDLSPVERTAALSRAAAR